MIKVDDHILDLSSQSEPRGGEKTYLITPEQDVPRSGSQAMPYFKELGDTEVPYLVRV